MAYKDLSWEDKISFRKDWIKSFFKRLGIIFLAFLIAGGIGGLVYLALTCKFGMIYLITAIVFAWVTWIAHGDAVERQHSRERARREIESSKQDIEMAKERLYLLKYGTTEERESSGYGCYNNYNSGEVENEIAFVENRIEYYTRELERHQKALVFYGG